MVIISLDLSSAFDLVNHEILIKKLKLYHFAENSLNLMESYLEDRKQLVAINGSVSGYRSITCGVPQGSILGPLLFILYINDLPIALRNSQELIYADDTTSSIIHASGKTIDIVEHKLNTDLDSMVNWCHRNKLIINRSKTNCMLVLTRQKANILQRKEITINFDGERYAKSELYEDLRRTC